MKKIIIVLVILFTLMPVQETIAQTTNGPVIVTNSGNFPLSSAPTQNSVNNLNNNFNSGINNGFIGGSGQCGTVFNAGFTGNLASNPQTLTNQQTENGAVLNSDTRIANGTGNSVGFQLGFQFYSQKCSDPKDQLDSQERISSKNSETNKYQVCVQSRTTLELAGKNPDVVCLRP
jgi:hypothetical protein